MSRAWGGGVVVGEAAASKRREEEEEEKKKWGFGREKGKERRKRRERKGNYVLAVDLGFLFFYFWNPSRFRFWLAGAHPYWPQAQCRRPLSLL